MLLAYDGQEYCGWQKTSHGKSIESTLHDVLEKLLQCKIELQAASRTDAKVHATGQVVNFFVEERELDYDKLQMALNRLLPKDIRVLKITTASASFHPTLDAIGKEYRYFVCYGKFQQPHLRHYSWHYHYPLELNRMQEAAETLCGHHDFTSFCNQKRLQAYSHHQRYLDSIQIHPLNDACLCISLVGNRFLYKMARNLVGILLGVGRGVVPLESLQGILEARDRKRAFVTAPAHALFLHRVFY